MNDNNLNDQNNIQAPVDNTQINVEQPTTETPVENLQPEPAQEPQPAQPEVAMPTEPQPVQQVPAMEQPTPMNNMNNMQTPMNNQQKNNKGLIIALVVFGLIIVGLVVFLLTGNKSKEGVDQTVTTDGSGYKENQIVDNADSPKYIIEYTIPKGYKASSYSSHSNKEYEYKKGDIEKTVDIDIEYQYSDGENACKDYIKEDKETQEEIAEESSEKMKIYDMKTKTINGRKYYYYEYEDDSIMRGDYTVYCTSLGDENTYVIKYGALNFDGKGKGAKLNNDDLGFLKIIVKKVKKKDD